MNSEKHHPHQHSSDINSIASAKDKGPETVSVDSQRKGNSIEAFFGIVCVVAGSGILGLPLAIKKGGWASITLLVVGFLIALYTGNLIIKCLYHDKPNRLDSYPEVGEASFGKAGRYVVQFCHYSIILGSVCVYIMISGRNFSNLLSDAGVELSVQACTVIAGSLVMFAYGSLKTIKEAVWLSAFGALTTLVVVGVVSVTGLIEFSNDTIVRNYDNINVLEWPSTLAIVAYSFGGSAVFPHIESSMKNKKKWSVTLAAAFGFVTFLYLLISSVGYLAYADKTDNPIYDNLGHKASQVVSQSFMTVHVLMAAPVYMCPFGLELEKTLSITVEKLGKKKEFIVRFVMRAIAIVILTLVATFVPKLDSIMTLIGAFANGMIIFVVPIVCHYKLFGWKQVPWYIHIMRILMLLVGAICVIFGTISAVKSFNDSKSAGH